MTDETIELMPCAHCGSDQVQVTHEEDSWCVECFSCYISTDQYVARHYAVTAWNRRHRDAAPEAELGRELIAWAAKEHLIIGSTTIECVYCHEWIWRNVEGDEIHHADDCLHLRARALRDADG